MIRCLCCLAIRSRIKVRSIYFEIDTGKTIRILGGPQQGVRGKATPFCLHVVAQQMQWPSIVQRTVRNAHYVESSDPGATCRGLPLKRSYLKSIL